MGRMVIAWLVVGLLGPASAEASFAYGTYTGRTSQRNSSGQLPLRFEAGYGQIGSLDVSLQGGCEDGTAIRQHYLLDEDSIRVSPQGAFSGPFSNSQGSLHLDGRISGTLATGTIEDTSANGAGAVCHSGSVSFSASIPGASCGTVRAYYREHRTRQYVEAGGISASGVSCAHARRIAVDWARHSRLSSRPARYGAGFRCHYNRAGSDVGKPFCNSGTRFVRFFAYDSSPFH